MEMVRVLGSALPGYVTLSKSPNLSEPQLPQLKNGIILVLLPHVVTEMKLDVFMNSVAQSMGQS